MSSRQEEDRIVDNLGVIQKGKLRANAFKPHWRRLGDRDKGTHIDHLVTLLEAEVVELRAATREGRKASFVRLECADVANLAAMIADVVADDSEDPVLT